MKAKASQSKLLIRFALAIFLIALIAACATVPGTGRQQLSLVDEGELSSLAMSQYREIIQKGPLSKDRAQTEQIKKVGAKIAAAAEEYLREHGLAAEIPNYQWEFNLLESKEVNAFCMPGGKVAFYSGILPYCQDETGIAVIMGHEVAHAIARHGNERASQQLATQLGGQILAAGLGDSSALTQEVALTAYGLGSQIGILLPYSRTHESEADRIGLILMAMAGYDPKAAIDFWQRMAKDKSGGGLSFLSTHPSDEDRISEIRKYLPEAEARFKETLIN